MKKHQVDICIVGGGPAGMVLGLCLAARGVKTLVLEKHRDFHREFRGEVLMPRFTQMFRQIGLADWLLTLPHLKLKSGEIYFRDRHVGNFDFSRSIPEVGYALWIPQTPLLDGLAKKAREYPSFDLWFNADVKKKIEGQALPTVSAIVDGESVEISARAIIGADGRFSTLLKELKSEFEYEEHNFDILWFDIPKPTGYHNTFKVLLSLKHSYLFLPKHPDSIQVGILVAPRELAQMRAQGIESLRQELLQASPLFKDFATNLKDFSILHPLQAHLHLVKEWASDGYLLIGDAAHCFSPAGAIGVSMAVGTAIVAADVITKALSSGDGVIPKAVLQSVQQKRDKDVRTVHRIQRRLTGGGLATLLPVRFLLPFLVTLIARTPLFRKFQRQLMGLPGGKLPISTDLHL